MGKYVSVIRHTVGIVYGQEVQPMRNLLSFLESLEANKIYYRLNKIRDSILVEIAVPGQRWEI